jgi:predicted aspartyl protease
LLGVTALESLGIEVDPLNYQLEKLPAVRLKSL